LNDRAKVAPELPTPKYGVVGTLDDGRHYVKFARYLPFSIQRVWSALTEPDQLAYWFPGLILDAREGGSFEIRFSEDCEGEAHVTGVVTTCSPPSLLVMGTLRWELQADSDGCLLTLTDVLLFDDRCKTDFTNAVLAGWHKYVDSLERALHGGKGDPRIDREVDYAAVDVPGRI
jgi:uncharacterized protein YndB with AHSA1/START domain